MTAFPQSGVEKMTLTAKIPEYQSEMVNMVRLTNEKKPVRVMLVDDYEPFCAITTRFLERYHNIDVVGVAHRADAALKKASQVKPQVILLDLDMDIIPRLKKILPDCKIIILTMMDSSNYQRITRFVGADEFILKDQMVVELMPAIHRVLSLDGYDEC
jgi:DNA-binding NarL/FixJ family response regulator